MIYCWLFYLFLKYLFRSYHLISIDNLIDCLVLDHLFSWNSSLRLSRITFLLITDMQFAIFLADFDRNEIYFRIDFCPHVNQVNLCFKILIHLLILLLIKLNPKDFWVEILKILNRFFLSILIVKVSIVRIRCKCNC